MNSWALMVALIGEGQEIHLGEESGLAQWNDVLSVMQKPWTCSIARRRLPMFLRRPGNGRRITFWTFPSPSGPLSPKMSLEILDSKED